MRKLLPHIVASFVFLLCFLVAADAFAQTTTPPLSSTAPVPKTGVVEGYLKEPLYRVVGWIAIGIVSFFAWLVGLAGVLLNFTVTYLVVGMGEMILKNGFGVAIENLWKLVRDLVNLAFIFSLLYLGITTIIYGGSSKVKSVLASIIISMLLVNFSLYFAKAVIDVGNFTAYTIYNVMAKQDGSPGYVTNESIGISGVFTDRVGAIQLLTNGNNSVQQRILEQSVSQGTIGFLIVYALGSSIFLFMLAFAFAYGAFLLVVRFVTLIIVMIFAPIAFLPTNVPAMAKLRDRWIKTLLTQAFVAPVYLFGFYVTLLVLMHTPWQTETGLAALFSGGNDFTAGFQALLFFVVAIAMLMGTTATAKGLAASGAEVSKVLTKAAGKGIAGISSTGGFLGRNIGGRISSRVSEIDGLKRAAGQKGFSGFMARRALNTSRAGAKGNWDLRSVGLVEKGLSATGVKAGSAPKTSYKDSYEKQKKAEYEYAKGLGEETKLDDLNKPWMAGAKKIEGQRVTAREQLTAMDELIKTAPDDAKRKQFVERKKQIETDISDLDKKYTAEIARAKISRQTNFAEVIEKESLPARWALGKTKYENKKTADYIRKETIKGQNKTDRDKLIDMFENIAKDKS